MVQRSISLAVFVCCFFTITPDKHKSNSVLEKQTLSDYLVEKYKIKSECKAQNIECKCALMIFANLGAFSVMLEWKLILLEIIS